MGISYGISTMDELDYADTVQALIKMADERLYTDKRSKDMITPFPGKRDEIRG